MAVAEGPAPLTLPRQEQSADGPGAGRCGGWKGEQVGGMSLAGCKGQAAQSLEVQMKTLAWAPCRWLPLVGFNLEESVGLIRQSLTVQLRN